MNFAFLFRSLILSLLLLSQVNQHIHSPFSFVLRFFLLQFVSKCTDMEDWLYDEGYDAQKSEFKVRFEVERMEGGVKCNFAYVLFLYSFDHTLPLMLPSRAPFLTETPRGTKEIR